MSTPITGYMPPTFTDVVYSAWNMTLNQAVRESTPSRYEERFFIQRVLVPTVEEMQEYHDNNFSSITPFNVKNFTPMYITRSKNSGVRVDKIQYTKFSPRDAVAIKFRPMDGHYYFSNSTRHIEDENGEPVAVMCLEPVDFEFAKDGSYGLFDLATWYAIYRPSDFGNDHITIGEVANAFLFAHKRHYVSSNRSSESFNAVDIVLNEGEFVSYRKRFVEAGCKDDYLTWVMLLSYGAESKRGILARLSTAAFHAQEFSRDDIIGYCGYGFLTIEDMKPFISNRLPYLEAKSYLEVGMRSATDIKKAIKSGIDATMYTALLGD